MDVGATLLAAIHDSPGDDMAWLALADWLEEDGEVDRAELLRLDVSLRRQPEDEQRSAREERLRALLRAGARLGLGALTNSLGMSFVLIAPGSFIMGATAG